MHLAVFTGSAIGRVPEHRQAAEMLGRDLAEAGVGIVYGGGRVGMMGVVADAALSVGGEVVGVITRHLVDREIAHHGLTRLIVVKTMHERKAMLNKLSDAFVALPGGSGTLDELFESWTWAQLGLHRKACALFDVGGFYTALKSHIDRMVDDGFLASGFRDSLGVVANSQDLLRFVQSYEPPKQKWAGHARDVLAAQGAESARSTAARRSTAS